MSYLYYILALVVVWIILNTIYSLRRGFFNERNLKIHYGLILVFKKTRVISSPRVLYSKVFYLNIVLFTVVLILFYYGMITSLMVKIGYLKGVPAQLLIPGVNITGVDLLFFLVSIGIAATVHELMHAYSATTRGVRVKSMGFAVVFIVPVAFTEVDEEDFKKTRSINRVIVLSAGPASNYLIALAASLLLVLATSSTGLALIEVQSESLAEKYGLKPGDIILKINNTDASIEILSKYMSIEKAVDVKLLVVSNREFREIVIHKPPNTTKLGVRIVSKPADLLINMFGQYNSVLLVLAIMWLYIVNFGLALVNAAPLFISDGGRIFYELFRNRNIGHFINTISLMFLILGVAPI